MKHVLTVTLNPSLDRMITVSGFAIGKEFEIREEIFSAGGKGLNVSRALKSLGTPTVCTGLLGGSTGQMIKNILFQEKIKGDFLKIQGLTRVNLAIKDLTSHKQTRFLDFGPKVSASEIKAFKEKYVRLLKTSLVVVLSGRNANGASLNFYADLVQLAHQKNVRAIVDTHDKPLELAIKAKPLLIKPNLKELEGLLSQRLDTEQKKKRAIHQLHKKGVQLVLLSFAENGAILSSSKEMWTACPPIVNVKNDVGCGDTMVAAFIHGYLKGLSLKDVLSFSVAAGTANAMGFVPGLIRLDQVKEVLRKVVIHKI